MKVLILSEYGAGLGWGWKLKMQGHSVKMFVKKARGIPVGDGIVELVDSWRPLLSDVDFIYSDSKEFTNYETLLKRHGLASLGTSKVGTFLLERSGEFLDAFKIPMCSSSEQLVGVHGFFNGNTWVPPFFSSITEQYFLPGQLGVIVPSMGCIVKAIGHTAPYSKQIAEGLKKLGLRGLFSIIFGRREDGTLGCACVASGAIVDVEEGIAELVRGDLGEVLHSCATGTLKEISIFPDYGLVVRVSLPPWPFVPENGIPAPVVIDGMNEEIMKHTYPNDMILRKGVYYASMRTGVPMKIAARGRDIREARRRAYRAVKALTIEDAQYRLDIGHGYTAQINFWKDTGFDNVL